MLDRIRCRQAAWPACLMTFLALAFPGKADAGRVAGTVVDRDGKPAGNARVWAARLGSGEPLEVREGAADGVGAFAIEAGPGDWLVFALRGDEGGRIGFGSLPKVEDGGKDPTPVEVRLGPPTKLRGRLVDAETGGPVPGGRFALDDGRRVEVDAGGRFEAPGLAPDNHEAYPLCPGYERKRFLFDTTGRPDGELELKLPRAGKVVGRVVDASGKPIPGATVGVHTSGTILSGAALWERCDEAGRFVYDGRPLGRALRLSAQAPGFEEREIPEVVVHAAEAPATVEFALRARPSGGPVAKPAERPTTRRTVSGTVVGPDGKPAAGALVRWGIRYGSNAMTEATTDVTGGFLLAGVPDEANVLSVMAKGLAPAFPRVESGGDREVAVELKSGVTIRGRVVDDAGEPIEGARVAPQVANPGTNVVNRVYLDEQGARTDRDGRFTLEGMPDGVTCDVVGEGRSAVRQKPLSVTDESKNVVTLLGEGAIRGRVVTAEGRPVRNFRVVLGMPKDLKRGEPAGGYFAGYSGIGLSFTRDDGEFTVTGLTAGNLHRVGVIAEGHGLGEADRVVATSINRLGPADALTIRLGAPHALRVRVHRADGKPIEGARVTAIRTEDQHGFQWRISERSWDDTATARTDASGLAEFPPLYFGAGTIVVRAEGFGRKKLGWAKDEPEFDVALEPEAKLVGTVLDEDGKPVAGASVTLAWGSGESSLVPVDEMTGRFAADELSPGDYRLAASPGNGPGASRERLALEAGKTVTRDIRVKRPDPGAGAAPPPR